MTSKKHDMGTRGVDAMVQDFVLRAGGDGQMAEICRRVMAQEKNGGVCLLLTEEEAEMLKSSPLVSVAPDDRSLFILDGNRFYTRRNWNYERTVRERLARMVAEKPDNGAIQIPEDDAFAKLNQQQCKAIQQMGRHCFTIMTGGPGTGKTYTIARAVKLILEQSPDIKLGLAAPTGKAAARVKEAMDVEAKALGLKIVPETSTLHKLLGSNYDFDTFKHNRDNPLDLHWLIVDEASMISLSMMAKLLDALPEKCRLTLVGDAFQLFSVEPGQVFGDLCKMKLINDNGCKCELTESRRFTEGGEIDTLAGFIKAGDSAKALDFLRKDNNRLVHYYPLQGKDDNGQASKEDDNLQQRFDELINRLFKDFCHVNTPDAALKTLNNCRILCALREGLYGCESLNDKVQKKLQKMTPNGPIPWMITRNDSTQNVSNGDVGVVMPAYDHGEVLFLPDVEGIRSVPLVFLPEREMAFASTIHKAQGSEYENVIIVLPPVGNEGTHENQMLTRELLYTALTRVKPVVDAETNEIKGGGIYLFATDKSIEECCKNETKRCTGLADYPE